MQETLAKMHTLVDSHQVEFKAGEGYAQIVKLEESTNGKVAELHFLAGKLKFPQRGWIGEALLPMAKEAQKNHTPLYFHLEVRRKKGVDKSIPIAELTKSMDTARGKVTRVITALSVDGKEWVTGDYSLAVPGSLPIESYAAGAAVDAREQLGTTKTDGNATPGHFGVTAVDPAPYVMRTGEKLNIGSAYVGSVNHIYRALLKTGLPKGTGLNNAVKQLILECNRIREVCAKLGGVQTDVLNMACSPFTNLKYALIDLIEEREYTLDQYEDENAYVQAIVKELEDSYVTSVKIALATYTELAHQFA